MDANHVRGIVIPEVLELGGFSPYLFCLFEYIINGVDASPIYDYRKFVVGDC